MWAKRCFFIKARKTKDRFSTTFRIASFAEIEFDLTLETGDKCILVLKMSLIFLAIRIREKNEIQLVDYLDNGND